MKRCLPHLHYQPDPFHIMLLTLLDFVSLFFPSNPVKILFLAFFHPYISVYVIPGSHVLENGHNTFLLTCTDLACQ